MYVTAGSLVVVSDVALGREGGVVVGPGGRGEGGRRRGEKEEGGAVTPLGLIQRRTWDWIRWGCCTLYSLNLVATWKLNSEPRQYHTKSYFII